jgi:hypothetical protein
MENRTEISANHQQVEPEETVIFAERQRCTWWFLWGVIILATVVAIASAVADKLFDVQFANVPPNDAVYIVSYTIIALIVIPSALLKLTVRITDKAIYLHMAPPPLDSMCESKFEWSSIAKAYVRDYHELKEYGGFGIRYGSPEVGDAISMNAKTGLQLELKSGRKVLISTRKPEELKAALLRLQR